MTNYQIIDKSTLGYNGKLYPDDMIIKARGAELDEIRSWSNMNESDPMDVASHIIDMIASCILVESELDGTHYTYKDLYEHDKLAFLLYIQMATFTDLSKHSMKVHGVCNSEDGCNKDFESIAVQVANIQYKTPDSKYDKYIDSELGLYNVVTKNYGTISYKPSTIGIGLAMQTWLTNTFEPKFLTANQQMFKLIQSVCTNYRKANAKTLRTIQVEQYNLWKNDELGFRIALLEALNIEVLGELEFKCPDCGAMFQCAFESERSYKDMFITISDFDSELQ